VSIRQWAIVTFVEDDRLPDVAAILRVGGRGEKDGHDRG
jgi:hypothetical protein